MPQRNQVILYIEFVTSLKTTKPIKMRKKSPLFLEIIYFISFLPYVSFF